MTTFASRPLRQYLLPSKYSSPDGRKVRSSPHSFTLMALRNTLLSDFFALSVARSHAGHIAERIPHRGETHHRRAKNSVTHRAFTSVLPSKRSVAERVGRNDEKCEGGSVVNEKMVDRTRGRRHRSGPRNRGNGDSREMGSCGLSSSRSSDDGAFRKSKNIATLNAVQNKTEEKMVRKRGKKAKASPAQVELRAGLDLCSKKGDVLGAIALYNSAVREGVKLEPYHYNVLLYLCSSAASGVVHPAKSGSVGGSSGGDSHTSDDDDLSGEFPKKHSGNVSEHRDLGNGRDKKLQVLGGTAAEVRVADVSHLDGTFSKLESPSNFNVGLGRDDSLDEVSESSKKGGAPIHVSDDVRDYARTKGFEIYDKMCFEKIPMTEAALTSVARMAMSMGNGDMAFEIVKQMKALGITARLRSYGPALWTFCNNGDVEKAFEVERHMLESGIYPEEPELAALLRASVEARRGEKVYYILHKLRTSVRQVSPSTADLIESWFKSSTASRVGKRKWDAKMVEQAIENRGGGWHGLGWLGKGKWKVARTHVNADGFCVACGEKLVTIDLDPIETANFAQSVASIASKRERNLSFQKFQKWLDYYGPFEAVVDAANVGLFSQRRFSINKVNAVVNAIRQKLPSKKWPLIIVHNKRLSQGKMDKPINDKLVEKWKNADAIYATPTGSNDDWYWLYAAIKCKCLIVTNDEMRDHTFQLLGNDFFPRWKERHQVHFSVHDGNFEFHMPPPCSIVIQESKEGHWHVPILAKGELKRESTWLCLTRNHSCIAAQELLNLPKESRSATITNSVASYSGVSSQMRSTQRPCKKTMTSPREVAASAKPRTIISDINVAKK